MKLYIPQKDYELLIWYDSLTLALINSNINENTKTIGEISERRELYQKYVFEIILTDIERKKYENMSLKEVQDFFKTKLFWNI